MKIDVDIQTETGTGTYRESQTDTEIETDTEIQTETETEGGTATYLMDTLQQQTLDSSLVLRTVKNTPITNSVNAAITQQPLL